MKFIFILLLFLNEFFENFVINDVLKEVIAKLHNGLCYNNLSCQTPPPCLPQPPPPPPPLKSANCPSPPLFRQSPLSFGFS